MGGDRTGKSTVVGVVAGFDRPDAVLAWFGVDGGFEVVVDPDQLYDLERIE